MRHLRRHHKKVGNVPETDIEEQEETEEKEDEIEMEIEGLEIEKGEENEPKVEEQEEIEKKKDECEIEVNELTEYVFRSLDMSLDLGARLNLQNFHMLICGDSTEKNNSTEIL